MHTHSHMLLLSFLQKTLYFEKKPCKYWNGKAKISDCNVHLLFSRRVSRAKHALSPKHYIFFPGFKRKMFHSHTISSVTQSMERNSKVVKINLMRSCSPLMLCWGKPSLPPEYPKDWASIGCCIGQLSTGLLFSSVPVLFLSRLCLSGLLFLLH